MALAQVRGRAADPWRVGCTGALRVRYHLFQWCCRLYTAVRSKHAFAGDIITYFGPVHTMKLAQRSLVKYTSSTDQALIELT